MMAGLNHESTEEVGGDLAIDLEVTSNRPDCLGHIGIAREVAVLWRPRIEAAGRAARAKARRRSSKLVKVRIDCPDLCYRVHGPRDPRREGRAEPELDGPPAADRGPDADQQRGRYQQLRADGVRPAAAHVRLWPSSRARRSSSAGRGRARRSRPSTTRPTSLSPRCASSADADDPVAIGGVMGGAQTEIAAATTRRAHRGGRVRSGVDPHHGPTAQPAQRFVVPLRAADRSRGRRLGQPPLLRVDPRTGRRRIGRRRGRRRPAAAAARAGRAAAFATQAHPGHRRAGGAGAGDSGGAGERGSRSASEARVQLQFDSKREAELGPTIPNPASDPSLTVIPPSWRRDLTREIDLIEEVARIHGYEQIPEDVGVPMAPSARRREDRVLAKIRHVLTAAGFDEALTLSVVDEPTSAAHEPVDRRRTAANAQMPVHPRGRSAAPQPGAEPVGRAADERGAGQSGDRAVRDRQGLSAAGRRNCRDEELMLAITSGRDYRGGQRRDRGDRGELKPGGCAGGRRRRHRRCSIRPQSCRLLLGGEMFGFVGPH